MAKILVLANNSSDAISGNISDVLETLDGVKGYNGDVTISDAANINQLKTVNAATTGLITVNAAVTLSGKAVDVAAALAGDIKLTVPSTVTVLDDKYTLAQLKAIKAAGNVTLTLNDSSVALSGTLADLNNVLANETSSYVGKLTVTSDYDLNGLTNLIGKMSPSSTLSLTKSQELSGDGDDILAVLDKVNGQFKGSVTINSLTDIVELTKINDKVNGKIEFFNESSVALEGTATEIKKALNGIKSLSTNRVTIEGEYTLADLKAINSIVDGTITVDTPIENLSGSAKDLKVALDRTSYEGKVTLTGSYKAADLIEISNLLFAGNKIVLANEKVTLTGGYKEILSALSTVESFKGNIVLKDANDTTSIMDTSDLEALVALTEGKITLPANGHINLDGTGEELQALLSQINGVYKGDINIDNLDTDAREALTQLKDINNKTSGDITITTPSSLKGSIKDIQAALKGITDFGASIEVTDSKYTLKQLQDIAKSFVDSTDINGSPITSAEIKLTVKEAPLSGSAKDLEAILSLIEGNTYTGNITVTGRYAQVELENLIKAFNDASSDTLAGEIKVASATALSGTTTELLNILNNITGFKGNITIEAGVAIDLDNLKAINDATNGKITIASDATFTDSSATVSEIKLALNGIKGYKGKVKIDDDYTLADLKYINSIVDGALTVDNAQDLSGNAKDLSDALNGITGYNATVTVNGTYNVAQLKAINTSVDGDIVLANKNVALTGNVTDIKIALSGIDNFKGSIKLLDAPSKADLISINNFTTGKITLPANGHVELNDTVANVSAALDGIKGYKGKVTLSNSTDDLSVLKNIASSIVVNATLTNTSAATLNGTVKELNSVLSKFDGYAGDFVVSGTYTVADLKTLNSNTTKLGSISLLNPTVDLTGKAADIAKALKNVKADGYKGVITLTDKPTPAELETINTASVIPAKIPTTTDLTGSYSEVIEALNGSTKHTGKITLDDASNTVAQVNEIAGLTTGVVTATLAATTTTIDDATVTALANVTTTDVISYTSTQGTADATALVALSAKVDTASTTAFASVNALTETDATDVVKALEILGNATQTTNVSITNTISANQADAIADKTSGVVTATIKADTAAVLNTALVDAHGVAAVNAYKLTVTGASAKATDLDGLNTKTSVAVDASAIKNIDGTIPAGAVDVNKVVTAANAGEISGLGNETVTFSTATVDADIDLVKAINDFTTGLITLPTLTFDKGVDKQVEALDLATGLGDLGGITGLAKIDAVNTEVDTITMTLANLLAANDGSTSGSGLAFTIVGDNTGTDSLAITDITGWTLTGGTYDLTSTVTAAQSGTLIYTKTGSTDTINITLTDMIFNV